MNHFFEVEIVVYNVYVYLFILLVTIEMYVPVYVMYVCMYVCMYILYVYVIMGRPEQLPTLTTTP